MLLGSGVPYLENGNFWNDRSKWPGNGDRYRRIPSQAGHRSTDERIVGKFSKRSRELSNPLDRERIKQATSANNAIRFKPFSNRGCRLLTHDQRSPACNFRFLGSPFFPLFSAVEEMTMLRWKQDVTPDVRDKKTN